MTTEEDFQAKLDAEPEDWMTRLVFADWLEERGDPRGPGYRALGIRRAVPNSDTTTHCYVTVQQSAELRRIFSRDRDSIRRATLPHAWCAEMFKLAKPGRSKDRKEYFQDDWNWSCGWCCYGKSRREAEDFAALAFNNLTPARRAKLLQAEVLK